MSLPLREAIKSFTTACESVQATQVFAAQESLACDWACEEVAKIFEEKCAEFGKETEIRADRIAQLYGQVAKQIKGVQEGKLR